MKERVQSITAWGLCGRQVVAVARTTYVEAIQQPVAFLLMLAGVTATLLIPVFQFHRFSEDGRLARDGGLSIMLVLGLVIAAGMAGRCLADEITRGTAAAALGKPVHRATFIFAKWLGVCAVVITFWVGTLAATLLAERGSAHFIVKENFAGYASDVISLMLGFGAAALSLVIAALLHYFKRQRFGVVACLTLTLSQTAVVLLSGFYNRLGEAYPLHGEAACCDCGGEHAAHAHNWLLYHPELELRIIPAALLILLALFVFTALATALATRLTTGANLAICAVVLFAGLTGDTLLADAPLLSLRGLLAGLLPDVQNFWLCDALAHGGKIPWLYVARAALYSLTASLFFLTLGCLTFSRRDLN